MASFVSLAEVRALVRSRLIDADLQAVIDREESWLANRIGALGGARTETFMPGNVSAPVYIRRLAASVVVTDNGTPLTADTDYTFTPSSGTIRRIALTNEHGQELPEPYFPAWMGAVSVTWTPTDAAEVKRALIELVRGTVGETGMESETIGDYSYTRGAGRVSRMSLVRSILLRRNGVSLPLRDITEPA